MPINLFNILNGVAGAKPPAGTRGGSPSNIAPSHGEGGFGVRDREYMISHKFRCAFYGTAIMIEYSHRIKPNTERTGKIIWQRQTQKRRHLP